MKNVRISLMTLSLSRLDLAICQIHLYLWHDLALAKREREIEMVVVPFGIEL